MSGLTTIQTLNKAHRRLTNALNTLDTIEHKYDDPVDNARYQTGQARVLIAEVINRLAAAEVIEEVEGLTSEH